MINTVFKKQSMHFFVLIFISIAVVSVAFFFNNKYFDSSLPIYDGVIYEKQQIMRFLAFKGNFSLIERYNQFVYELTGSPVGGGFTALTCLINPKWLDSGFNISVRSFFVLFFFFFSLYKFLSVYLEPVGGWLILILISQFPLFYHFRFGLASYVPDLPAGLSLCAAFLFTWLVSFRKLHFFYLYLVPVLISIAVFSRYNFFVYSFLLFVPLIIRVISYMSSLDKGWRFWLFLCYFLGFISLWISYGLLHFDFFISYYAKPAEYQHVDYQTAFLSLSDYLKNELGVFFVIWTLVLGLLLISLRKREEVSIGKERSLLWLNYPFLILFVFLFLILKSTNQPHVFAAFFVFFIPFLLATIFQFNVKLNIPYFEYVLLFALCGLIYWNVTKQNERSVVIEKSARPNISLANYLMKYIHPGERYFLMHDSMLEIPIDVHIYRSRKIWLQNDFMFYNTDWNFYDIEPSLDSDKLIRYYQERISKENVRFITVVNDTFSKNQKATKLVFKLRQAVRKYIFNNQLYQQIQQINTDNGGIIYVLKKKLPLSQP